MVLSIALLCYIYVLILLFFLMMHNGNNDEAAMSDKEGDPAGMCSATSKTLTVH